MRIAALVVSCEHAGNRVPAAYRRCFRGAQRALRSHRGWDAGALELARGFARRFRAPLLACTTTRLLVDANRSAHHPHVFSEWSRTLAPEERERVLESFWAPHRDGVEAALCERLGVGRPVLHLSVHSFTPRFEGRVRKVDVGFLHDPARPRERTLVRSWRAGLAARRPDLRLRLNAPYRGTADGLTTTLRRRLGRAYLGLELEVSQRFPRGGPSAWAGLRGDLVEVLEEVLRV